LKCTGRIGLRIVPCADGSLGFALESFDGIGMWRTREGDTPVDVSGTLPTGASFHGMAELRTILLSQRELFVRPSPKSC